MSNYFIVRRLGRVLAVVAFLAIAAAQQACGAAHDQIDNPPPGSIGLALAPTTMVLAAGDSSNATVTITRANVTGDFALSADNVPPGVTTTFTPRSGSGGSATLTVRASASVAAGTYELLIRGMTSGAPGATATLALSVVATPAAAVAFKSVVTGTNVSCALTTTGQAYCWGSNNVGQLGNGTKSAMTPTPTAVAGASTFESLSLTATGQYVCGLRVDGTAYCWGSNALGQIGDGTVGTQRLTPTAVAGGLRFVSLSAGGIHTCGLTTDSLAYCWGDNTFGQFGDGTVKGSASPVPAAPGLRFTALVASDGYACGLTPTGVGYCWGLGSAGVLGNGGHTSTPIPVAVSGGLAFTSITAGGFDACGLTASGDAYCWGNNSFGDVGDGTAIPRTVPTAVAGGVRFTNLLMGREHACGVATSGTAYCWGENDFGSLGDGTTTHRFTPTAVGGLKFRTVSIGDSHTCGVTEIVGGSNDIYCWGNNSAGQLGDGTTTPSSVPLKVRWP